MVVRILIMTSERGESQEGSLIVHHEIDDALNGSLGLLEADRTFLAGVLYEFADCWCGGGITGLGCRLASEHAPLLKFDAFDGVLLEGSPERRDRTGRRIESSELENEFPEVPRFDFLGKGNSSDAPQIQGVDHG